jgi:hypothetical protein
MTIQSKPSNDLFLKNYDATFHSKENKCRCPRQPCDSFEVDNFGEITDVCYCVACHGEADEP